MAQEVRNRFTAGHAVPEKNKGPVLVDRAGYISAQKRIENLMFAGQVLKAARREEFDRYDGEEPEIDPTRNPGYDTFDAIDDSKRVSERLKKQKEEAIEKAKNKGNGENGETKRTEGEGETGKSTKVPDGT